MDGLKLDVGVYMKALEVGALSMLFMPSLFNNI